MTYRFPAVPCSRVSFRLSVRLVVSCVILQGSTLCCSSHCPIRAYVEELIFDAEQRELINKAIAALPEIQRRRFLLYHEYDFNYRQIGEMEHCRPQSIRLSVIRAREKIKAEIEKYRAG